MEIKLRVDFLDIEIGYFDWIGYWNGNHSNHLNELVWWDLDAIKKSISPLEIGQVWNEQRFEVYSSSKDRSASSNTKISAMVKPNFPNSTDK